MINKVHLIKLIQISQLIDLNRKQRIKRIIINREGLNVKRLKKRNHILKIIRELGIQVKDLKKKLRS